MNERSLGPYSVRPIGLGGMPMSLRGRPPEAQSIAVIHAALDAGMNLIDTADVYCIDDNDIGHNERLIRTALSTRSERPVVATKGGLERPRGAWPCNGRPEHLRRACERSLVALGVDQIQVYQLHAPDDDVPFAESVGALAELRAAGKIAHVGLSNVSVVEIEIARRIVPIVSVQNRCGYLDRRDFTNGVIRHCEQRGIAYLAYSPVNGSQGRGRIADDRRLGEIAARHGVSPFQVALAWLLHKSPVILPIPGASRVTSAIDSAAAMDLSLTAEDMAALDRG